MELNREIQGCYTTMAVVQLLLSQSLPDNGSTCNLTIYLIYAMSIRLFGSNDSSIVKDILPSLYDLKIHYSHKSQLLSSTHRIDSHFTQYVVRIHIPSRNFISNIEIKGLSQPNFVNILHLSNTCNTFH
jgi:hypothetical protein